MKTRVFHTSLFAGELAVLLAVIACAVGHILPIQEWAYSAEPQELIFEFSPGQKDSLSSLSHCCVYYTTWEDPEFSERQKILDRRTVVSSKSRYSFVFPARLTKVRIDFRLNKEYVLPKNVPSLSKVRLGGGGLPDSALVPFRNPGGAFFGYTYVCRPFMNGWWRVIIPVAAVIWLITILCAWRYFKMQSEFFGCAKG